MGLDTVELIMHCEEEFGIEIDNRTAETLVTPRLLTDHIVNRLDPPVEGGFCPPVRAYCHCRDALGRTLENPQLHLRSDTRLRDLYREMGKRRFWDEFPVELGLSHFADSVLSVRWLTVSDIVTTLHSRYLADLKRPEEPWTRPLIRHWVRGKVFDLGGIREFSDDDHFVENLGLD